MNDKPITIHKLKILTEYAYKHLDGVKPWEIRKNDRDFKIGDLIHFVVIDKDGTPTGITYNREITYILKDFVSGLYEDCVFLIIK